MTAVAWIGDLAVLAETKVCFRSLAGAVGEAGVCDGFGVSARFSNPSALAADGRGQLFIADSLNHVIRKIGPEGQVTSLAGFAQDLDEDGIVEGGASDGVGPAARFNFPAGVAVDVQGFVYVSDAWNHTIRRVSPAGMVTTIAGQTGNHGHRDGPAAQALFDDPCGIAVDSIGNLFVAERGAHIIRKISREGAVVTLAGLPGQSGTADGQSEHARFDSPGGVALDSAGNLWVADTGNHTIRMVTQDGLVKTVAGVPGTFGHLDGEAGSALFSGPSGLGVDRKGVVYVADTRNNAIRRLDPSGFVETISSPELEGSDDSALAPGSHFLGPSGLALGSGGAILVADAGNNVIRTGVVVKEVNLRVSFDGGLPVLLISDGAGRSCTIEACSDPRPAAPWTTLFKLDLTTQTVLVRDHTAAGVPFRLYRVRP